MRRILLAIRIFFVTLFNAAVAGQVERLLGGAAPERAATAEPTAPVQPRHPPARRPATRSDALTLLAALQREARLIDFLQEPLGGYGDAQIGAAARDVHRDCAKVLARLFAIQPILSHPEGAEVEVPAGFDAGCYRLSGNVAGEPPFRGRLVHPGWQATTCELPSWSGSEAAARVLAPVEVELK
jgi:hypothetical protein